MIRRVVDSPHQWYGESPTPRLLESESLILSYLVLSLLLYLEEAALPWLYVLYRELSAQLHAGCDASRPPWGRPLHSALHSTDNNGVKCRLLFDYFFSGETHLDAVVEVFALLGVVLVQLCLSTLPSPQAQHLHNFTLIKETAVWDFDLWLFRIFLSFSF